MHLVAPNIALESGFLKMVADFKNHDPDNAAYYAAAEQHFGDYCAELQDQENGIVKGDNVPCTTRWFQLDDETIVGAIRIRHHIDHPYLSVEGGHIGYDIAPSFRRQGYGTAMLSQALTLAKQLGLAKVMLVTDADNRASQGVIQRCGGQVTQKLLSPQYGTPIVHFWIGL